MVIYNTPNTILDYKTITYDIPNKQTNELTYDYLVFRDRDSVLYKKGKESTTPPFCGCV